MRPIAQRAIRRAILRSIAQPMAPAPFRPHFGPDMPHPTLTRTAPGDGGARLTKKKLDRLYEARFDAAVGKTVKALRRRPVLNKYSVGKTKHEKPLDDGDKEILRRIGAMPLPPEVPTVALPSMHRTHERARMDQDGVTHLHHFFLPRAALWLTSAASASTCSSTIGPGKGCAPTFRRASHGRRSAYRRPIVPSWLLVAARSSTRARPPWRTAGSPRRRSSSPSSDWREGDHDERPQHWDRPPPGHRVA